ncbi:hypothetical protein AGABI1DRAFT_133318 [Agaricus bisporus var. burnettii JB137-S8]|uniref:R3H domain-containing protein n=1 Tax=Agaricus bisporus var. burnettii (strain JB137-S8 / ATCC MYA-4627 / FGSC 10392) TaxID=597362 RepID=K5WUF4_AGABU|nr:uncharacterized protein AGABI1DRAFT_133318 [Agaricus bisporus var. burnettii JB137-S8]EKM74393.1 hypothetical protein AGABI1DRAFT_133318 [Agaricus bisporus var. burnettii JB137-S8]
MVQIQTVAPDLIQGAIQPGKPNGGGRRAKFRGKLTENDGPSNPSISSNPSKKYRSKATEPLDDLTSRLIRELSSPPYPDCPICFSSVYREQPIWSCSPSIPTILPHGAEGPPQYCWATFHLKCIRSWASKNVKDLEDAWRARSEEGRTGDSQDCSVDGEMPWIGKFACDQVCERLFDCGIHKCTKSCHPPPHKPALCPRSPTNVTHCPCGNSTIAPSPDSDLSQYTFPARTSFVVAIPAQQNVILDLVHLVLFGLRGHVAVGHLQRLSSVVNFTRRVQTRRLRYSSLAITTGGKKGKKRLVDESANPVGIGEERGGLHECDLEHARLVYEARLKRCHAIAVKQPTSHPPERRKFVHDLATYYRIDTQFVDQEPHRSVQLLRRLDTRIPNRLLSTSIQSSAPNPPNLGKLGDLRNPKPFVSSTVSGSASGGRSTSPWRPLVAPSPKPATATGTTPTVELGASNVGENTLPTGSGSILGGWSSIVSPQPRQAAVSAITKPPGSVDGGGSGGGLRTRSVGDSSSRPSSAVAEGAAVMNEPVRENWEDDE